MFPGCTHTHTCTHIFPSPLEQPLSIFSLHSVQITSRWDKSIMFPEKPRLLLPPPSPNNSCIALCVLIHFSFLLPLSLVLFVQKDILISLEDGGWSRGGSGGALEAERVNKTFVINSKTYTTANEPMRARRPPL